MLIVGPRVAGKTSDRLDGDGLDSPGSQKRPGRASMQRG
jgi:hypothetical protein